MKTVATWLLRPFEKIAGWPALLWGLAGMALSTLLSYLAGYHYHGLLHFGPAPNDAWWVYAVEHLVVWLIPALLFWVGGLILSRSRIRPVDVFGTVAFAQLPFLGMNLYEFTPPMQRMAEFDFNRPMTEIISDSSFLTDSMWSLFGVLFLVLGLIWMFNALKVSCNLKGTKLGLLYAIAVLGGDAITRIIISSLY